MPTPNAALARRVLEHIEAHPDSWLQSLWAQRSECGTTYCFAGWTIALTNPDAQFHFVDRGTWVAADVLIPGTGGHQEIPEAARNLLNLSQYAAGQLFDARNSLDDLRAMVAELESPTFGGIAFATGPVPEPEEEDDDYDDYDEDEY